MPLLPQIQLIRAYTQQHPELLSAHHFVYDLPVDRSMNTARFVVMGINPGEQEVDWAIEHPTEETRDRDFRQQTGCRSKSADDWIRYIDFFCGTREVVMSEFFFWSSRNLRKEFKDRFGTVLHQSPHLDFCATQNIALVNHYSPKAVIAPGLSYTRLFAEIYGLRHVDTFRDGRNRLVEHFQRSGTPWLFTKHWSGSFGFSRDQRQMVRRYISEATGAAATSDAVGSLRYASAEPGWKMVR